MQQNASKEHLIWVDNLRSLAIICVVLCHSVEIVYKLNPEYMSGISLPSYLFALISFIIGRSGVPFFLFISGYLLLDNDYSHKHCTDFWRKKTLPLLICTECWIIIYHLFLCFYHDETFYFADLIKEMFFLKKVDISHMWYMPMILGMYLFIPIAAIALQTIPKNNLIFPFLIISAYIFLTPIANVILQSAGENGVTVLLSLGFSGGCYGIYLVSGYFMKQKILQKLKRRYLILIAAVFFMLALWLQLFAYKHSYPYNIWYDCGFLLIYTLCIFELFRRMQKIPGKKFFYNLSKYSFGIYLIHNIIIMLTSPYIKAIKNLPLQVIILWIFSLSASYFLSVGIRHIPRIGKYLLYK